MKEPGDQQVWKLPFKVVDEDGVEWNVRMAAFDGVVYIEQYRFEPGKRIMRDVARMDPDQAVSMARGLKALAVKAAEQNVEMVHEV